MPAFKGKVSAEHLLYWPYACDQIAPINPILHRFHQWKLIIDEITSFFIALESIEAATAREHMSLVKALDRVTAESGTSVGDSLVTTLREFVNRTGVEHGTFERVIEETAIKKLRMQRSEVSRRSRAIRIEFMRAFSSITQSRTQTLSSIHLHERGKPAGLSSPPNPSSASTLHMIPSSPGGSKKAHLDPYLTERALKVQLQAMVVAENEFQDRAKRLWKDAEEVEKNIVREIVGVVHEFVGSWGAQAAAIQELMRNSRSSWNSLDPGRDIREFSESLDVGTEYGVWNTPRGLRDFPYSPTFTSILKSGMLYRQGTIRKSVWKPCWVVLTETGWLHCFNIAPTASHPSPSLLKQSTTNSSRPGSSFWSSSPRPVSNMTVSRHHTSGMNTAATSSFLTLGRGDSQQLQIAGPGTDDASSMMTDTDYTSQGLTKTIFSVSLRRPRLSVNFDRGCGYPFVFKISIGGSGSSSSNYSNGNVMAGGVGGGHGGARSLGWNLMAKGDRKGEIKYALKATTESDMVEWIAAIRKAIQSHIPLAPPEPLFHTADTIGNAIEAAMGRSSSSRAIAAQVA